MARPSFWRRWIEGGPRRQFLTSPPTVLGARDVCTWPEPASASDTAKASAPTETRDVHERSASPGFPAVTKTLHHPAPIHVQGRDGYEHQCLHTGTPLWPLCLQHATSHSPQAAITPLVEATKRQQCARHDHSFHISRTLHATLFTLVLGTVQHKAFFTVSDDVQDVGVLAVKQLLEVGAPTHGNGQERGIHFIIMVNGDTLVQKVCCTTSMERKCHNEHCV